MRLVLGPALASRLLLGRSTLLISRALARFQVVAGINYRLTITYALGDDCKEHSAVVYDHFGDLSITEHHASACH